MKLRIPSDIIRYFDDFGCSLSVRQLLQVCCIPPKALSHPCSSQVHTPRLLRASHIKMPPRVRRFYPPRKIRSNPFPPGCMSAADADLLPYSSKARCPCTRHRSNFPVQKFPLLSSLPDSSLLFLPCLFAQEAYHFDMCVIVQTQAHIFRNDWSLSWFSVSSILSYIL